MVFSSRFGTKPYFQSDNSVFERKKINYIKPEEWMPSSPNAAPMDYSISQVDDSGHRIRTDPVGNAVFSGAFLEVSAYFRPEKHRKMEAVFRLELHRTRKRENPASSLYRILSGSKRDPRGKPPGNQRFPSEPGSKSSYRSRISAKKYWFPRDADKIIQYFFGHGKTNKKSLLKISVRLSLFFGISEI